MSHRRNSSRCLFADPLRKCIFFLASEPRHPWIPCVSRHLSVTSALELPLAGFKAPPPRTPGRHSLQSPQGLPVELSSAQEKSGIMGPSCLMVVPCAGHSSPAPATSLNSSEGSLQVTDTQHSVTCPTCSRKGSHRNFMQCLAGSSLVAFSPPMIKITATVF